MQRASSARPSSALSNRPSSARITRTKAFFDQRDGSDDHLDPPIPFNANNEIENENFVPLLGDSGDEFTYGWGNLKTVKPCIHIEEPLTLIGLPALDRCIAGYFGRKGEHNNNFVPDSTVQDVIQYFGHVIIAFFAQFAHTVKAIFVNEADLQQRYEPARSVLEERIRREIETNPIALSHNAKETTELPKKREGETKIIQNEPYTSFWAPDQKEVWRRSHKNNPIFDVTVQVEEINIHQHPLFSDEESAVSQMITEYKRCDRTKDYSLHIAIKDLLKRIIDRNNDGTSSDDSDLLYAAEKIAEETNHIKNIHNRIERLWDEVIQARKNAGFNCTDVEMETLPAAIDNEFDDDLTRLLEALPSLKLTSDQQRQLSITTTILRSIEHCKIKPNMIKTGNVVRNITAPKKEKLRRKSISSENYFARLLIDNHPVGDTRRARINLPSFSISISHRFRCNLSEQPDKSCIQVFFAPAGFLPARLMCSIFVTIPQFNGESFPAESFTNQESYAFSSHNGLKGSMLVITSVKVIPSRSSSIAQVPRHVTPSSLVKSKHPLQVMRSDTQMPRLERDVLIPNRQFMMAFQCNNQTLLSTSLQEPTRHILLKKRRHNLNVPSPIPFSNLESKGRENIIDYSSFLTQENADVQEVIYSYIIF